MQDETMVRCIDASCGRALARRVNFCPYCGEPQHADAANSQQWEVRRVEPEPSDFAGAGAVDDGPPGPAAAVTAAAAVAATPGAGAAAPATARPAAAPPPPSPPPPSPPPRPAQAVQAPPARPSAPPQRQPVRLRWWLLALALLWAVWLIANPKRRIEAQMDKAIALAAECKAREAQSELIALRKTRATPEQLQRVQTALNEAGGACTRKRQRDKAWREAKAAVDAALADDAVERARQRLRSFTRRWGEDEATRALKETIDARRPEHPRADEVERE